mmetsp:Transcript_34642/g.35331  ORF Transcript_34642/g.35331 Transcript_34642/m.35331 type:complete len:168 (+) Transcript_34642:73-576(+)
MKLLFPFLLSVVVITLCNGQLCSRSVGTSCYVNSGVIGTSSCIENECTFLFPDSVNGAIPCEAVTSSSTCLRPIEDASSGLICEEYSCTVYREVESVRIVVDTESGNDSSPDASVNAPLASFKEGVERAQNLATAMGVSGVELWVARNDPSFSGFPYYRLKIGPKEL